MKKESLTLVKTALSVVQAVMRREGDLHHELTRRRSSADKRHKRRQTLLDLIDAEDALNRIITRETQKEREVNAYERSQQR